MNDENEPELPPDDLDARLAGTTSEPPSAAPLAACPRHPRAKPLGERLEPLLPAFLGAVILGSIFMFFAGWFQTARMVGSMSFLGGRPDAEPSLWPVILWSYTVAYVIARFASLEKPKGSPETSKAWIALARVGTGAVVGILASFTIVVVQADWEPQHLLLALASGACMGLLLAPIVLIERALDRTGPLVQRDIDAFVLTALVTALLSLVTTAQLVRLSGTLSSGSIAMPGSFEEAESARDFLASIPGFFPMLLGASVPYALAVVARRRGWRLMAQVAFTTVGSAILAPVVSGAFMFSAFAGNLGRSSSSLPALGSTMLGGVLAAPLVAFTCELADRLLARRRRGLEAAAS